MDIPKTTRQFYPEEQRVLKTLKAKREKELKSKIKYHYFVFAGLLGIGFTYLASITQYDFLVFVFGTIAVFAYGYIVFMPYEIYKGRRKLKTCVSELNTYLEKGTVTTCLVKAKRIAVAREYEDEGDLFIIEYDFDKVLYLWDYDSNLKGKFPCFVFEIYEDRFYRLLGRQVCPLSEPVRPLTINKKAKWAYMKKIGTPEHLQTEKISFDKLLEQYNNVARHQFASIADEK